MNEERWKTYPSPTWYPNQLTVAEYGPKGYPRHALPKIILQAAADIQAKTKAPGEMIAAQCLGVAAAACQGLFDVEMPHGDVVPLSLFIITLGKSGERKSTVNQHATKTLSEFDQLLRRVDENRLQSFKNDHSVWETKRKGLAKQLEKSIASGISTELLEERLQDLLRKEPKKPKGNHLIHRDTTPAALKKALTEYQPIGIILSDEAGAFFSGPMLKEAPLLNDLWCGTDLIIDRVETGTRIVESPRMSMALMLQPELFIETINRYQSEARDSGFLARCLICSPTSTQGTRINSNSHPTTQDLSKFQDLISGLLKKSIPEDGRFLERIKLRFDEESKKTLNSIANEIENMLQPLGSYALMPDFASKIVEHIARIAAIFHAIEGASENNITVDFVKNSHDLVLWYAREFDQLVANKMAPTEDQKNSELILNWLNKEKINKGQKWYTVNDINRHGPNRLRDAQRIKSALELLQQQGKVWQQQVYPTTPKGRLKQIYSLPMAPNLPQPYLREIDHSV